MKPNKQTTWNTSLLHEIAWSSGKLDNDELFAVFYDINVMNAEVLAKGLEKCRLFTRLLGQSVESLDDYGYLKTQDLVGKGKMDKPWICSTFPFRHKRKLHCAERKAKMYGEWAMQHWLFLYVFIVFVITAKLIVSTRHDLFNSVHFEKLSFRNRRLIKKIVLILLKLSWTTTIKRRNLGPAPDC